MCIYVFREGNLNILDAYKVPKSEFNRILTKAHDDNPEHPVWNRSFGSLRREWAVHNLMYVLGLWKNKTKDASLDYPQKWYARLGYSVVGAFALLVIK